MPKLSDDIGRFTPIPNAVIESRLSANAFRIYCILAYHVNRDSGQAWPSYDLLQSISGMCRPTVSRSLTELLDAGLVTKKRRFGRSTVYMIHSSSKNELLGDASSSKNELSVVQKMNCSSSKNELDNKTEDNKTESNKTDERAHARANSPTIAIPAELRNQPAPPRKQRTPKPHEPTELERLRSNASVACYYETFGRWPDKLQARAIIEVATDAPKFSTVCSEWAMKGYKATNVAGILDVYQHGWRIAVPAAQWPKRSETGRERAINGSTSRNGKSWRRPQVEYSEEDRAKAYEEARKRLADTTKGQVKI